MLSIRVRIVMIVAIVLFVTSLTLGVGVLVGQRPLQKVIDTTLVAFNRLTAGVLSSEIGRLKEETRSVAGRLVTETESENVQWILDEQVEQHHLHLSLSVMYRDGTTLHAGYYGAKPTATDVESADAQDAFDGETVIATTSHTPGGELIMRIWTPIDENRILVTALRGLYLSDFLDPYRIWDTDSIFVIDGTGTYIARSQQQYHYRVLERRNYLEHGTYPGQHEMASVHQRIIDFDEDIQRFLLEGRHMLSASNFIPGTDNWFVATIVPVDELPGVFVWKISLIVIAIIIILGIVAALAVSGIVAKPYKEQGKLKREAETASRLKSQFLSNISHEIRTPLSAIIGLSEMELEKTELCEDSAASIKKIHRASMTVMEIINDLLDLAKIESGKLTLVSRVYDVPGLISDTAQLNIVNLGKKPVLFRLRVNEAVPVKFKGDDIRVKQIFNNLLSNAFKYTEMGFVKWGISCTREGNRVKIVSTVEDTGIGIRREDHAKLFKDYSQVNLEDNHHVQGTGLGLSITKKLVELMGGSIRLESDYLKGSTFTVEFFQQMEGDKVIGKDIAKNLSQFCYSTQHRIQSQGLVRADMSYATVLLVDDMPSSLEITKEILKPYKIKVDTAESGNAAVGLVLAEKVRYDAIFMDHIMPGMDGIQAAKAIREGINSDYAKTVPIIALTANALQGSDALYFENGFQAFLSQPVDVFKLDQVLNQWVRNEEKEKELAHQPSKEKPRNNAEEAANLLDGQTIPGLNAIAGYSNFQYDKNSYVAVLRSFVKHIPSKIVTLKTEGGDLDSYRIAVHGLKGSSRGIGAEQLGEMAETLEKAAIRDDLAFIRANNSTLIETVEKLIVNIAAFLETVPRSQSEEGKPEKENPDMEILKGILQACTDYDMVALRKFTEALSAFRYASAPDLAQWITEQAHLSNFDVIQKRVILLAEIGSP